MLTSALFFGELGLDGSVRRVSGLLPAVMASLKHGYTIFFIPAENVHELVYIPDIKIYPLSSFRDVVSYFMQGGSLKPYTHNGSMPQTDTAYAHV